jgi:hypothetical protein
LGVLKKKKKRKEVLLGFFFVAYPKNSPGSFNLSCDSWERKA